jgi:hypothetical protein
LSTARLTPDFRSSPNINPDTDQIRYRGVPRECEYRNKPCFDRPTHELLWELPCGCPPVWFLCKIHTGQIMMECENDNSRFICLYHDVIITLIAVNPL